MAVREIRDELFEIQHEGQDHLAQFVMPDGSIASTVQTFNIEIELEGMPQVTRIYKHWLWFGHPHPQFANIFIMLA